jgi:adenine-specific DNA-methyltransferase
MKKKSSLTPESYKHGKASRVRIPSREEAGTEQASPKVASGPTALELPKNPIVERGQDPELYWLGKYGLDDTESRIKVDIRSLYRSEHIAPEQIINGLYHIKESDVGQPNLLGTADLFGNTFNIDELEKPLSYYKQPDDWSNRIIQGDSLLVMTSLAEREGMAGTVQTVFLDPPYGIKYGGNWQIKLNDRNVTDGKDEHLTGEGEQIKAFRDTWELGIHSYLSYMRDRLLVTKELLHQSGSCFVQIGDENVHLVRSLMDEVFGAGNFVSLVSYKTTSGFLSNTLSRAGDYVIWYAKSLENLKYRQLFQEKGDPLSDNDSKYDQVDLGDIIRPLTKEEKEGKRALHEKARVFRFDNLQSQGASSQDTPVEFKGVTFRPNQTNHWKANWPIGMERLKTNNRLAITGKTLSYIRYFDDYPLQPINNFWHDIGGSVQSRSDPKVYVVQTGTEVIKRCILMTTDPGDLVLDPTCGSGTTAYVAEQWGRRWITIDTSRIAINIAKTRLLTATFPHYSLNDQEGEDIRQGFIYKEVPHITLGSIANDEPAATEKLYDKPEIDKSRLRVSGPFTVETLQQYEPMSPDELKSLDPGINEEENTRFMERIFAHLQSAGIKTGDKRENAVFSQVEALAGGALHAVGYYSDGDKKERKAYIHIGPKFGTVTRQAINDAIKECRREGDADWLLILGFSFELTAETKDAATTRLGTFEVTRVRMADDLLQEGLIKKDKKAATFVSIGEPDIKLHPQKDGNATVEVLGVDIYDPITDQVKNRDVADIAYFMVDTNYDGNNFHPTQFMFCGGEHDEFDAWKKGLSRLAVEGTKKKVQRTLKIELDEEAFEHLYGTESRTFKVKKGQKVAVRVISQFGEETTKVIVA